MNLSPSFPSPRRRYAWVILMILSSFTLFACNLLSRGGDSSNRQPDTAKTVEVSTSVPVTGDNTSGDATSSPTTQASDQPIALEGLPRSFRYAGLQFNLQRAEITTQPPEGANFDDQRGAYALTEWKISNPATNPIMVNEGIFTLQIGEETFTRAFVQYFDPQDTKDASIVFSIPAGVDWQNASIRFNEPGKVPAVLALTGEPAEDPFPKLLNASGEAALQTPLLTFTVESAAIDLDGYGKRVEEGKQYLLLEVTAACEQDYGCFVGPDSFRLLANGDSLAAQTVDPISKAVDMDTSQKFLLAFQIPEGTAQAELQVGEIGKETAKIPLDLSAGQ